MEELISAVSADLLQSELTGEKLLRRTNKADNEIYMVSAADSPNVLQEIGRLRELTFRAAGGGTGKPCDLDRFDLEDPACHQLIVWNPEAKEIIGGYRFTYGNKVIFRADGQPDNNMAKLFEFSGKFVKDYLPYTIEMARAFVQPKYQSAAMRHKSLFALDNLWEGIGALVMTSGARYLMGKVSVYSTMKPIARDAILYFMEKSFGDPDRMITSRNPHVYAQEDAEMFDKMFSADSYKDNYKILNTFVREQGESIPPLIHSYIGLSNTMLTFGTCFDPGFGDVYDTAMLITLSDVSEDKMRRYVYSFRN